MTSLRGSKRGFSFIELLIASAIVSTGLAGVSLMLLAAISGTAAAGNQYVATYSAESLAEFISVNMDSVGHFVNPSPVESACERHFDCPTDLISAFEMANWQTQIASRLPNGSGMVCRDSTPFDGSEEENACDGDGGYVVKIFWQEPFPTDSDDDGRRRLVTHILY